MITLRDNEGIMIARFSDATGMKIINALKTEGEWSTFVGEKSREARPCFRVHTDSAITPFGNDDMKVYIWAGSKFIMGEGI